MAKKKQGKKSVSDVTVKRKPGRPAGKRDRVPHTHYRLFGRNVKIILDCMGKSENSFAIDAGLKQPYVNKLFNGRFEPRLGTVFTIADALGVPVAVLLSPQVDVVRRFAEKLKKMRENDPEAIAMA